jgi:hypothetical protein
MKSKNALLNLATVACTVAKSFMLIFILGISIMFIIYLNNPSIINKVNLIELSESTLSLSTSSFALKIGKLPPAGSEPGNLNTITIALFFFQGVAVLGLLYLVFARIQKIISSFQNLKTFTQGNVDSFKRIGRHCLLIFLFSSISYLSHEEGSVMLFKINFAPLLFALASFILAEIFKEGQKLYENEKLTI